MLVKSVFVATISADKANSNESTDSPKAPVPPSNCISKESIDASAIPALPDKETTSLFVIAISEDKAISSRDNLDSNEPSFPSALSFSV